MIPVLSAEQMRMADAHTIAHEPISSLALMERAALRCTNRLMEWLSFDRPVLVLAGMGNNGGDGLVMARALRMAGQQNVKVLVARYKETGSTEFEANLARWVEVAGEVVDLREGEPIPEFAPDALVVDALFGTGLQRPLEGWLKEFVRVVNRRPNEVLSIDLPSGLFADTNAENDSEAIVQANRTYTLELPKRALLLADNYRFAGDWEIVPIGLDRGFVARQETDQVVIEAADAAALMPWRSRVAHKGDRGHAWLLAGGPGKMGAAVLAAHAALRSGCGLLTTHLPKQGAAIMHQQLPEAMAHEDPEPVLATLPKFGRVAAIGVGPGMGTADETARLLKRLVQEAPAPLVLDADALNILAENRTWLAFLPAGTILTPHPKELERLVGKAGSDEERLGQARELARRNRLVVVLKGAYTAICSMDGRVFHNRAGNPGMAKGGSGDVLTGILTGLRAQGLDALSTAILGVYAHARAGDLAAAALGEDAMLPSDLINSLSAVWQELRAARAAGR